MRLLFDQNLSHRLVALLAAEFPGSEHVRNVGLAAAGRAVRVLSPRLAAQVRVLSPPFRPLIPHGAKRLGHGDILWG